MKILLLLPSLLIALTSLAQTKLTIQSADEKCAHVATDARNVSLRDDGFSASYLFEGGSTFVTIRSFLQFDLSSIPTRSFVNWARLSLFAVGQNFGSNTSLLRRITSSWDPATVTWNTQPSTAVRGTVRLPMSTSAQEDYKNINVTNLLQVMVDSPNTSFGFALRLDTDERGNKSRNIEFISPIFGKVHYNPKLVMEYTAPGMQPAVTSMSVDLSGASIEMNIYPNPCDKAFNYNIKSTSTEKMNLRVIDMLGRTVYSQPVNTSSLQMRVNLPSSSAGTYFVILQGNNGTIVSQEVQIN